MEKVTFQYWISDWYPEDDDRIANTVEKLRKKAQKFILITFLKLITVHEMGVDKLDVDKIGLDEMGSRRSGNKLSYLIEGLYYHKSHSSYK